MKIIPQPLDFSLKFEKCCFTSFQEEKLKSGRKMVQKSTFQVNKTTAK